MDEDEQTNWEYKSSDKSNMADKNNVQDDGHIKKPDQKAEDKSITWTASEYIEHNRSIGWYVLLAIITAGLAAGLYFLTKDIFATVIITIMGIVIGVFASRKPRKLEYELSEQGLRVGEKSFSYNLFKTFSVVREGSLTSVVLLPIKKFMPPVSAYFDMKDEDKIVKIIGKHLPYEERQVDRIDRLSRRLRF